ncbi:MAG TPA: zinc ribbon domain-containing protein [Sulfuricaulis sp.]|nr:zinc ribbon domain-containing protein [Sulfuricaulis sp.]
MTARSIFQKVCPECMATVPLDTRECSCGHHLDHDDTDAVLSSEEIRLKAEELYENYLAARVEQAAKAVKTSQAEFARDPSNTGKSDHIASAIHEVQLAESALAAQSARVAEMKKALLSTVRPAAPAPVVAPARKRATALKAVAAKPQARITRKPIPVLTEVVTTATPPPVRPKHQAKVVATALKKPPSTVAQPRKPDIAPPAQTATPNPAFRQAQAAKAEKILSAKNVQSTPVIKEINKEVRMVPVTEPKPPQTTPIITAKSAPRLYAPRDKKECPNCTASVTIAAARCRCGYEFPSSEQLIPALAMSDEERAEFAKLFNFP